MAKTVPKPPFTTAEESPGEKWGGIVQNQQECLDASGLPSILGEINCSGVGRVKFLVRRILLSQSCRGLADGVVCVVLGIGFIVRSEIRNCSESFLRGRRRAPELASRKPHRVRNWLLWTGRRVWPECASPR
jgi:hypothetical protein